MTEPANPEPKPAASPLIAVNIVEEGRGGGPLKRITAVARMLKGHGVETTVVCPLHDSERLLEDLRANGVKCIAIRLHRLTKSLSHLSMYLLFLLPELFGLWRVIRRERADIVHCNGAYQMKGMLATKFTRAKAIWHLNDTHQPRMVRFAFGLIARFFADGFIVASERTRQYYLSGNSLSKRPTIEIQAPVDVSRFDPEQVAPASDVVGLGCPVLTTVGNVNHYKGLNTFIRMAHRMNQLVEQPVAFAIVGPVFENQKPYHEGLLRLCDELGVENMHFLGYRSDVHEILKASAIYICASNFEASPISIWEAMAMGMPIVSTDVGDVRDILEKNNCGRVAEVADHERLAVHAAELLANDDARKTMGRKAREVAINQLDLTICTRRHAEFYRRIAKKP